MAKGPLSEEKKAELRTATHESAAVLLDDLKHIRSIVVQETPSAGDLRRLSSILRRILVESGLRNVATPRVGKIDILGPDLRIFYRENEKGPFALLVADRFKTHGIEFSAFMAEQGPNARPLVGYEPDRVVPLRVEPFQNQKVLCVKGEWVTRADIIKYVANVAHGIHSGSPKSRPDLIIRNIRQAMHITLGKIGPNGKLGPIIKTNVDVLAADDAPIEFQASVVDLALLNLLSTAQFLTESPDVISLESEITRHG